MKNCIDGKNILITGVCGTVGAALTKILLSFGKYNPKQVIGIDNNESQLFFLDQEYSYNAKASFYIADIRDKDMLSTKMKNIDVVFHVAALKHVILCEKSPFNAVQTNIHGVQNVISASKENGVERVIFTSSDKAVNPTNVMGTSKLMGERLITAANNESAGNGPIFASTRFGNVMGSNGSVIPIFHRQIVNGGPLTLTDYRMSRFVMSINEAAELVIDSASEARGGEVFVTKMPVINISDLADVMLNELSESRGLDASQVEIKEIGAKPGEKLYEELMSIEETSRAIELEKYFAILPAFRGVYEGIEYSYENIASFNVTNPYVSSEEEKMSKSELREFLVSNSLI